MNKLCCVLSPLVKCHICPVLWCRTCWQAGDLKRSSHYTNRADSSDIPKPEWLAEHRQEYKNKMCQI